MPQDEGRHHAEAVLAILLASAWPPAPWRSGRRFSFQSGFLGYLTRSTRNGSIALSPARPTSTAGRRLGFLPTTMGACAPLPCRRRRFALALLIGARTVVGNPEIADEGAVRPIVVEDRVVGWIARTPLRRLSTAPS